MHRETTESPDEFDEDSILFQDRSFWGMTITQFLGAFNDNLFKQLILLLALAGGRDVQGWATMVFSLPFVVLSGFAGFLSDRFSKNVVIVWAKFAEVIIMFLGVLAFLSYDRFGSFGTWTVLLLMGTHSTFFGPGKYGILPELFREKDLPRANGFILMTTFLAIITGTVVAGAMCEWLLVRAEGIAPSAKPLWIGSMFGVGLAVIGVLSAWMVRRTPPAQPTIQLKLEDLGMSYEVRSLLATDLPLLKALLASCVFWLVSGIAVPTVNKLGTKQLGVGDFPTSILVAAIALGIVSGSIVAGVFLKRLTPKNQVSLGLWGIVVTLIGLGLWRAGQVQLLGYSGSFATLFLLGASAAIYSIPLQVFLQQRPPACLKGRMIATMNQANFVGILLSGPIYQFFEFVSSQAGWPISSIFLMMMLLVLPLAIFYRLESGLSKQPS